MSNKSIGIHYLKRERIGDLGDEITEIGYGRGDGENWERVSFCFSSVARPKAGDMNHTCGLTSWNLFFLISSFYLNFAFVSSDDTVQKDSGTSNQDNSKRSSSSTALLRAAIIFFVVSALALCIFFLLKRWRKKKREEQHARLLKLFEEDDELELELGLRD